MLAMVAREQRGSCNKMTLFQYTRFKLLVNAGQTAQLDRRKTSPWITYRGHGLADRNLIGLNPYWLSTS